MFAVENVNLWKNLAETKICKVTQFSCPLKLCLDKKFQNLLFLYIIITSPLYTAISLFPPFTLLANIKYKKYLNKGKHFSGNPKQLSIYIIINAGTKIEQQYFDVPFHQFEEA